jgi:hypothetical protein
MEGTLKTEREFGVSFVLLRPRRHPDDRPVTAIHANLGSKLSMVRSFL